MAYAPPVIRVQAAANYNSEQQSITKGFSETAFKKDATAWRQLRSFCSWLQIDPDLKEIEDPIPFLQILAEHVRASLLSAQRKTIKKLSVEQYLHSIGQIFASVGANDPHHNRVGKLDFRLGHQMASYQKLDSPPT